MFKMLYNFWYIFFYIHIILTYSYIHVIFILFLIFYHIYYILIIFYIIFIIVSVFLNLVFRTQMHDLLMHLNHSWAWILDILNQVDKQHLGEGWCLHWGFCIFSNHRLILFYIPTVWEREGNIDMLDSLDTED